MLVNSCQSSSDGMNCVTHFLKTFRTLYGAILITCYESFFLGNQQVVTSFVAPLNVKTTLNVKTAKCEKPNNRYI